MNQSISAGTSPRLTITRVAGDLSIVGWDGEDVLIKSDEEITEVRHEGEDVTVSCDDDLAIRMPRGGSIAVQAAEGDMSIRTIAGSVYVQNVSGDISARDVETITIDNAQADVSLRSAGGPVRVKHVGGDASLRGMRGDVTLEVIAADLVLREADGNVHANVGGDTVIYLTPRPDTTCNVTAGDDILLVLPPKANATLSLSADSIDVELAGVTSDASTSREITLGDGSAHLTLHAGGDVRVTDRADEAERADEFGNFAGMQFDWSGLGERISRKVEKATRGIEKKAVAAVRHARRNVHMPAGPFDWGGPPGFPPGVPSEDRASGEERLAILRMLEEKKITADEAEQLLSALEGEAT